MPIPADPIVVELYQQYVAAKPGGADAAASAMEQRASALEGTNTLVGRYQASVAYALVARLRNRQLGEPAPAGY